MALMKLFLIFSAFILLAFAKDDSFVFNAENNQQLPAHTVVTERQNFYQITLPKKIPIKEAVKQVFHSKERIKRANTAPPPAPNGTSVANLKDSTHRLIIHWSGQGSGTIIVVTGDNFFSNTSYSRIYISTNYGKTFVNRTTDFRLLNGNPSSVDNFFTSPIDFRRKIFADVAHKYLFVTFDEGQSVLPIKVTFKAYRIVPHPSVADYVLALDTSDNNKLYASNDFGTTWKLLDVNIKAFYWGKPNMDPSQTVFLERQDIGGLATMIKLDFIFQTGIKRTVLATNGTELYMQGSYIFVVKSNKRGFLDLLVSKNRGALQIANFPLKNHKNQDYFIVDSTTDQVLVVVDNNHKGMDLYISDASGLQYTLSLQRVLYFNPFLHATPPVHKYDLRSPLFADITKLKGLLGVYVATQLTKPDSQNFIYITTLITYNNGAKWKSIKPPATDSNGNSYPACISNSSKSCSLHLGLRYTAYYQSPFPSAVYTSASAPGFILGHGSVGANLTSRNISMYISTDGGFDWREAMKGQFMFAVADHGGLIAAVRRYYITNVIYYSWDEGESWSTYIFNSTAMLPYGLTTEPGEQTTVFTIVGSPVGHHEWTIVQIDMKNVLGRSCTLNDYKKWVPSDKLDGAPGTKCVLGRKMTYERRKTKSRCYNGRNYDRPISVQNCTCIRDDFECDEGYYHSFFTGNCFLSASLAQPPQIPVSCPEGSFYYRTRGYRKIADDTCFGGVENTIGPQKTLCPVAKLSEFLLFSQRFSIGRFRFGASIAETLPINLIGVSFIDYDFSQNCLYWGENGQTPSIRRMYLNGTGWPEVIVSTKIAQVGGMALDWISNNIYWIDQKRKELSVAKKDGTNRRTLLTTNMDNAESLILDPARGYLYWTNVNNKPSIMRANMDGTGITTIVQSNLGYPSGLALDITRQQLYWTDKTRHIIETATSQGHSRRTIITSSVTYPTAIAVFKDSIYWADSELKKIFQANNNGGNVKVIASSLTYLTDVKAFRQASQTGTNGCANNNGGCSHLCAPLPNNGHVCLCPDNAKTITSNGKMTCVCESGEVLQPGGFCSATNSSSCKSNQFTCNNHKCIPKSWHCDHDNDCGDNSDELGCSFQTCASWQFTCSDGRCISNFRKCDFIKDCRDGSDELNCVRPNCTSDEFRCNNKRCIRKSYVCDGDNDCYDNSDEKYCVSSHSCKSSEFRCKNGACIPKTFFCDKFNDCGDNSDEPKKCTPKPCTINQFVCNNGECIPNIWRCDGIADCGDSSDEKNCNTTTTTAAPTTQSSQCGSNQFKCKVTKFCIPLSYVCDGVVDCQGFFIPDSSDEANCPTTQPSGTSTPSSCGSNSFACLSGGCIPKASVCNHVTDCSDGSDELDCGFTAAPTKTTIMPTTPTNCSSQQFDCGAGSLPRCIPASFRCDNEQDCSNDADERHCQACSGFKCANGVCLKKNSQVCNGINECGDNSDEKHCASHQCSNSEFRCTSGQCIVKSGRCDGFNQCSDGSDEKSCDIVSSLVAAPFSAHSLRISWKYVQNSKYQVDHYRIYYRISGHNLDANYWPSYVDVPKFYHSKIISNLQPQTTYDATVTIITKSAAVLRKAPFVTTSTYASKPLPPKNLKAFVLAANKIKVTWEASSAPGVVIKNYKVAYRFGFLDTTITTRNSFVIISNLIPFTTYYVRVAAGTYDNVFSDYTNEYVVHTAPAVRITNGKYEFEGRVEVFHNNEWGTVCDGNWNIKAATVVCKQLGYYEAVQAVYFGQFGGSQGKIWLNNVHCSGSESSLLDCTHSGWSNTTCTHANDAGVVCSQAPVRLVGGLSSAEGRVEIKHNGFWGTICNFGWRIATSNVVCRSLGFPGAKPVNLVFGQTNNFGPGNGTVWLSNVRCQGNESFITECPYSGWGISSSACNSHRYDVGVSCLTKPVRLVTANQVNVYKQGTIEVSHKGKWGTICDHNWDQNDAVVICKQLGYTGAIRVAKMAEFGQGNGTVWLTDVQCKGNELNLHQCPSSGWGNNKCKHTHDAGVVCSYPMVRLVGGNQPNQGRLEINFNGVWGTVCDDRFDITDANVVCKQLGFIGAAAALGRAPFGQGNGPIWLDEVQCNGTEQSIGDCAHNNWNNHNCGHNEDVGIVCDTSEVRLVGGNSTREGRLEIIHNGRWGTICSNGFTKVDADVACRELGFSQADSVTSTSHFGSGTGPVWMQGVACKGSEKHLKECHFSGWGNSNCAHTNDVGIICSIPPVRLAGGSNGTNYAEGRVEIFHRQKWGTICDDYWDLNDANVICRQLKLPPASAAPKNAFFGAGTGPIWLDDVKCTGSETYINQCNTSAWQSHNCIHKEDAGVVCGMKPTMPLPTVKPIQCSSNQKVFTCKPNECIPMFGRCDGISQCSNGADEKNCLRLKTTTNNYTGMVEINHRGLWGTVCDDFWNLPDAIVLCRQLGFKGALQPLVMGQGGQGSANQPIWLDNVLCKGNETDIRNCQHSQFGVHNCDHTEDAGVICASGTAVPVTPTPSGPCHHWQFACDNNQKCIWFFDLCDNVTDCQDGSDEANCGGSTTVQPTGTTTTGQCGHGRFKCHNGQCINSTYVCNKRADCADGSDELNCGFSLGPTPSPGCSDTQFRCQFSKTCIPNEALCNGINDCTDGSDEHNCKHPLYFVSQLAAIKIASYQVTLGWTLTRTPQQYSFKVYSRQTHSGKSWKMEGQTSNFTYVVKNLSPFTQYSFTVSVIEPNRNGLKATPISIRTLAGKPGSPLNVKASSIHSSSIAVIWMAPKQSNGNILFYGIFIHGGSIMSKVIKTSGLTNPNGPGLRYIIDNLRANTNYYIQVAAYSSTQGYGPKSPQIQVKTSVVEAPSRLNISMDPSTLKVVVTWKPAASSVKIQSYDLTVRANDPSSCVPIRYVIVDASVHTANIKHLIPGMEYIFSIAAVADGGQKYSGNSEIFVSKGVKPIPRDLSISATTNAIYLNWKEPVLAQGMKILNYYVHESVSENSGSKDYTTTKTTFSRPLTNTTYLYRVSANTNFGSGPCSKFLTYNYYPVPTAAPQSLTTILEISLPIAAVAVLVLIGACYYFNSSRRLRNRLQTFVGSHFRRDTDEATFLMSGDDDDDVLNDDGLSANDPTSDDDGLIRA